MADPDLARIAAEYRDINGSSLEIRESPPSALEFSRLVHISRPVLIKGGDIDYAKWSNENLIRAMGNREISVALTPRGQGADALTTGDDGECYFAEPHVEKMTMEAFLGCLGTQSNEKTGEVYYLQSQNGNLYPNPGSEFEPLLPEVPNEIPWATEALGRSPDAVNLWIGDSHSTTSVHSDPYENLYTVVRGAKHFTLFPPTEAYCLREKSYKHAQYIRSTPSSPLTLQPSPSGTVRWSSILDPSLPGSVPEASPFRVTVHAGEILYLPPGWWHHVKQTGDKTGICIALNWWYDMEMRGMHWIWLQYLRGTLGDREEEENESE
ncbi:hypothetical protein M422DRAFT_22845 [Sphaerobolus stellatus SS14]|nr:hypothetical protein M422DRAFT_22845 [Sphaerobolus stellatus SS14]